jgi:phosphodiesterase/alkaline phosphatase D-like protein
MRRTIPRLALALLALLLLVGVVAGVQTGQRADATSTCGTTPDVITHGPRLGEVTDGSVLVWVRSCVQADVAVQYKLSSEGWEAAQETAPVATDAGADNTAVVAVTGLQAATAYDYRVEVDGLLPTKPVQGSFETLPTAGQGAAFTFIAGSDIHHPNPTDLTLETLASQDALFAFFMGDTTTIEKVMNNKGECCEPQSQADYESAYQGLYSYQPFAGVVRDIPTLFTWDDHEILDNWQSGTSMPYPWARAAYQEYIHSGNPAPQAAGEVYFTFGAADIEFYFLDTKTFRSPDSVPDGPSRTMLGTTQKQDLLDWLATSNARFKFIISSVMWNDFAKHIIYNETWANYATERAEIFDFITDNHIPGVVLLSGDEHWTGAFHIAPWGIYEIAPAPVGGGVFPTTSTDPQILYKAAGGRIFGLFDVDTTLCPATLTVRLVDQYNVLRYVLPLTEMDLGADADGDTLPPCQEATLGTDPFNADTDGDGCPDPDEIGPIVTAGGLRDPTNPWDYFNPTGDGKNRVDDVLAVVGQFYVDAGNPNYAEATDRTLVGPNPWNLGPPDGFQRVVDVIAAVKQFFHDCP